LEAESSGVKRESMAEFYVGERGEATENFG
jgi:hypothetical protein